MLMEHVRKEDDIFVGDMLLGCSNNGKLVLRVGDKVNIHAHPLAGKANTRHFGCKITNITILDFCASSVVFEHEVNFEFGEQADGTPIPFDENFEQQHQQQDDLSRRTIDPDDARVLWIVSVNGQEDDRSLEADLRDCEVVDDDDLGAMMTSYFTGPPIDEDELILEFEKRYGKGSWGKSLPLQGRRDLNCRPLVSSGRAEKCAALKLEIETLKHGNKRREDLLENENKRLKATLELTANALVGELKFNRLLTQALRTPMQAQYAALVNSRQAQSAAHNNPTVRAQCAAFPSGQYAAHNNPFVQAQYAALPTNHTKWNPTTEDDE